jgi:putative hemolysin
MNSPWFELILLVFLTGINALFTGSEIAFVSLREGQLQRLDEDERGRRVVHLARNPSRFLATVQIGITLAGFLASATAAVSLSEPLQELLEGPLGTAANTVSVIIVTVVLAYFTLVFGELAPKRIAMQRAERWALYTATLLGGLAQAARPAIWLLERSTNLVVRLAGSDPNVHREEVTEEEIRDLVEAQETFSDDQRSIIAGAFEIAERTLREVVVPRGLVIGIPATTEADDAVTVLAESGHSRAPVHTGDLDDVVGIVHLRDLIHRGGTARDFTRPATVLPESLGVLDALRRLQTSRQQMAIVVNEHGGVEGIVTVEDLLEEIVGEIYDEFDREIAQVERADDGAISVPGSFPIHDLPDIDVELPDSEGAYATIAGYVLDRLGHIPVPGEVVQGERWDVEVLEVAERAITRVRLVPHVVADDVATRDSEQT